MQTEEGRHDVSIHISFPHVRVPCKSLVDQRRFLDLLLETFEFDLEGGARLLLLVEFADEIANLIGELRLHLVHEDFHFEEILLQLLHRDRTRGIDDVRADVRRISRALNQLRRAIQCRRMGV